MLHKELSSSSCSHFPKLVKNVVSRVISSSSCIMKRILNVRIKIRVIRLTAFDRTSSSIDFWETLLLNNLMATRKKIISFQNRKFFVHNSPKQCGWQQIKQWLCVLILSASSLFSSKATRHMLKKVFFFKNLNYKRNIKLSPARCCCCCFTKNVNQSGKL